MAAAAEAPAPEPEPEPELLPEMTEEATRVEMTIRTLQIGQLFRSIQWAVTNTAQSTMALQLCGGDQLMVVRVMTGATTISAAMELCFSPFFGQVIEKMGRKRLLTIMGLTKFPAYVMMAIRPSLFWLALGPMVGEASYQVYKLAETTVIADMISEPKALAVATARVQSMMGAAQVLGNLFGGILATLNPRWPYFLGSAAALLHSLVLIFGLRENSPASAKTSQPSHASPAGDTARPPPSALAKSAGALKALLFGGRTLRILTLSALTDNLVDLTWTLQPVFAREECRLTPLTYGAFEATRGLVRLGSGQVVGSLLRVTGVRGFNLISHAMAVLQQLVYCVARGPVMLFASHIPRTLGEQGVRNSVLLALHTRAGEKAGLGLGDVQGSLQTIQSLVGD